MLGQDAHVAQRSVPEWGLARAKVYGLFSAVGKWEAGGRGGGKRACVAVAHAKSESLECKLPPLPLDPFHLVKFSVAVTKGVSYGVGEQRFRRDVKF